MWFFYWSELNPFITHSWISSQLAISNLTYVIWLLAGALGYIFLIVQQAGPGSFTGWWSQDFQGQQERESPRCANALSIFQTWPKQVNLEGVEEQTPPFVETVCNTASQGRGLWPILQSTTKSLNFCSILFALSCNLHVSGYYSLSTRIKNGGRKRDERMGIYSARWLLAPWTQQIANVDLCLGHSHNFLSGSCHQRSLSFLTFARCTCSLSACL